MYNIIDDRDGHIHTPFCPHGTKDSLEDYVKVALQLRKREISFTEHFPMPEGVTDSEFQRECALTNKEVPGYIQSIKKIRHKYKGQIKINVGFEVDYIEGYEEEIKELLNSYGEEIEDSLLSVHFLKVDNNYYAVDYLPHFEKLLLILGSLEKVYDLYYQTVLKSLEADLGPFKPKRIAHPSLVRIFNKKYPFSYDGELMFEQIIDKMKEAKWEVDLNLAGLRKPYCQETYPTGLFLKMISDAGIPIVLGSDAHSAKDIQKGIIKN